MKLLTGQSLFCIRSPFCDKEGYKHKVQPHTLRRTNVFCPADLWEMCQFHDPATVRRVRPFAPQRALPYTHTRPAITRKNMTCLAKDVGVHGAVLGADWLRVVKRSRRQ